MYGLQLDFLITRYLKRIKHIFKHKIFHHIMDYGQDPNLTKIKQGNIKYPNNYLLLHCHILYESFIPYALQRQVYVEFDIMNYTVFMIIYE